MVFRSQALLKIPSEPARTHYSRSMRSGIVPYEEIFLPTSSLGCCMYLDYHV